MNWIDEVNKKLEEQRKAYKESIENGAVDNRKRNYIAKIASDAVDPIKRADIFREIQKKSRILMSKEDMIKRGKILGENNVKSGRVSEMGKIGGKNSGEKSKANKIKLWKEYLLQLPDEFNSKELRNVLLKDEYTNYKAILKSELVEKIYEGKGNYDPPRYKKVQ